MFVQVYVVQSSSELGEAMGANVVVGGGLFKFGKLAGGPGWGVGAAARGCPSLSKVGQARGGRRRKLGQAFPRSAVPSSRAPELPSSRARELGTADLIYAHLCIDLFHPRPWTSLPQACISSHKLI